MKTQAVLLAFIISSLSSLGWASADKSNLEKARSLYNRKQYQRAVETYSSIPKQSDYYLEALEEKAQALGQMGKYAEALSELKSAMAPQFAGLVGPEVYQTAVITQLKTCDYVAVLETTKKFKAEFSDRLKNLTEVVQNEDSKLRSEAYAKANTTKDISINSLGPLVRKLPRHTTKDKKLSNLTKNPAAFAIRLQQLAREEIKAIEAVIDRIQIAEVEVEHRLNVLSATSKRKTQGGYQKSNDVLVFPDNDEVWFDEIGNYQAQVETCPDLARRAGI